jgi:hypothetical protein
VYLCALIEHQMSGQNTADPVAWAAGGMVWVDRAAMHHPAWLFIGLILLLGLFAWIRKYYGSIFEQTMLAATNFQVASRMFLDNSLLQKQLDTVLYVFYLFSTAFFLYGIELQFRIGPYDLEGFFLYLFDLGLLAGIFLARLAVYNLAGFLFNRLKIFREHLYNTFIYNKIIGIFILPFLLLTYYTNGTLREVLFWSSMVLVLLILLLRMFRSIIFSLKKDVSIFYMFLYLCALEIAPLLLLYRWLEGIL